MRRQLLTDTRRLFDHAAELGLDATALRAIRGTEPWADLPIAERVARGNRIWGLVADSGGDEVIVRLARLHAVDDLGALGLAMRAAPTLGEALDRLVRYQALFMPMPVWEVRRDGDDAVVTVPWNPPLEPVALRLSVGLIVAILPVLIERLAGAPAPMRRVRLRFDAPPSTAPWRDLFGVEPEFGHPTPEITLPAEVLARPLPSADPALSSFVVAELESLATRDATRPTDLLLERLREQIRRRLASGAPSIGDAARAVAMSERTLRRRLAEAGTTWADLVDATREALAREWLADTDHELAEIAFLLGFSEPSAFHRAFKRWTGATPTAFRNGRGP